MIFAALWEILRHQTRLARGILRCSGSLWLFAGGSAARAAEPGGAVSPAVAAKQDVAADEESPDDALVSLAAYNVKADQIEDFGLRVASVPYPRASRQPGVATLLFAKFAPEITAILPNTAAARAGLKPGERILRFDGVSSVGGPFSLGKNSPWQKAQTKKWAEVAAGKAKVSWTLEIETPGTRAVRTVTLTVPTPRPHWGASVWHAPVGRVPSVVTESGPLAARSREMLDHGIATLLPWPLSLGEGATSPSGFPGTGYQWIFENGRQSNKMVATQEQGRTRVFFETISPATGRRIYQTSPSGKLEKAWRWGRKENIAFMKAKTAESAARVGEVSLESAREGFEHELDLWSRQVGKVSARWPFEVKPGYDADAIFAVLAAREGAPVAAAAPRWPADFLRLPPATDAQRTLFGEAYRKLGTEADRWAYTETSRGVGDKHVLVARIDPSQPEARRSVLLSVDGKTPTPAEVQQWRDDGGDMPKALGELPPLASVVELKELRIFKDEGATVVFELPLRGDNADFPAEKFQAHFRVNRARGAFEDVAVKLRDSFRVAGVVQVVDAGLELRFQTLDPAFAPQPVFLKAGGGARVLLVKVFRSFEATRTDFQRVVPFDDAAAPAK